MGEIILPKSLKNLKKIQNRLSNYSNVARTTGYEEVLFLAMGGYNRTYELIKAMGVSSKDIATFSNLTLSPNFIFETHMKKVIYIRKINYVTSVNKQVDYTKRTLDLNVADGFEESMMIYKTAHRKIGSGAKVTEWIKPTVIILDDQSLNLQYGGHRFYYQSEIGFVQVRNRNVSPDVILSELHDVEEASKMMFALYQQQGADEAEVLDALNKLRVGVQRQIDGDWYMKPTEFKKLLASKELEATMREIPELGIEQLKTNKKIGKENARWIIIPESAFDFKGFSYKDEEDIFKEELEAEEQTEARIAAEQEQLLNKTLLTEFAVNIQTGYTSANMSHNPSITLKDFTQDVDAIESEINGIQLLSDATSEEEYKNIKKHHLAYFLDGTYENDYRKDDKYIGGKRLISIDIDDHVYTRQELEEKLEMQNLFGMIYPTAKFYYNGEPRWRILLMADEDMTKDQYKLVVDGVSLMLDLEIDEASKKISQLMGYPLAEKDISIVTGTMVNVKQFKPKPKTLKMPYANVVDIKTTKSLLDVNHNQARLLKQAVTSGIPEGQRNDAYRQIILFLRDTQNNPEFANWHEEARKYESELEGLMISNGIHDEKERELILR